MAKNLDLNEIEALKHETIEKKVESGDWYQYAKEPAIQKIVKDSSQAIQKINDIAKENFDEALHQIKIIAPNIHKTVEIYFPINSIEHPKNITVGEGTFINSGLQVLSAGKINIGKHCFIGPNCALYTPNHHPYDKALRREGWQYDSGITIGDDCWFGGNVTILPGVRLGNNVVVGAGSVVTKSFENDVIIAGNPAKILKQLS